MEAKSVVLAISRGPELRGCRERERGSSERRALRFSSGGMQRLVGEEHDFVVDSVKCRKPAELSEQWRLCGASLKCNSYVLSGHGSGLLLLNFKIFGVYLV